MKTGFALVLLALALAAPARASERHPTLAQLDREVMCPTCHTLLELSDAPIAQRMRSFIREQIASGKSDSQIKTLLVANFGDGVLAAPPARGFGLLAWLLPLIGVVGGGAVIGVVVVRWKRTSYEKAATIGSSPNGRVRIDPALERLLEDELARFDR